MAAQNKTKVIRKLAGHNGPKVLADVRNGKYSAPVAIATAVKMRSPAVSMNGGNPRFRHKELVASIRNTTGAVQANGYTESPQPFRINPLNPKLFNWLSSVAGSYDEYKFTSLKFTYVASVGTTESGRVFMSYVPDSQDPIPTVSSALTNQTPNVSVNTWKDITFSIPVDGRWRFVDDSNVADKKLVDLGQFIFAVWNGASTNILGEIYVEYAVEFKYPQSPIGPNMIGIIDVGGVLTSSGQTLFSNSDILVTSNGASMYIPIAGTYNITCILTCSSVTNMGFAGNCTGIGVIRSAIQGTTGVFTGSFTCTGIPTPSSSISFSGVTGLSRVQIFLSRNAPSRGLAAG